MASRSRLSYQSIESKGGVFAKKKPTYQQRKIQTRVSAQDLWEIFETSKNPAGEILDLVDRVLNVAFTKLEPETSADWPKVEQLLKYAFVKVPKALRDLRSEIGGAIDMHMRADVGTITASQMKEIDEEVKTAHAVLDYLLTVLEELQAGVEDFLSKEEITTQEYRALAKDISSSLRNVKSAMRQEFGGLYVLPQPLKLKSRSRSRSKQASRSGWKTLFRKK